MQTSVSHGTVLDLCYVQSFDGQLLKELEMYIDKICHIIFYAVELMKLKKLQNYTSCIYKFTLI